ncbi:MAG TPA: mandelate racemase/muconate lactonizing enzyme family protein [Chloroflexota bacterium]|nr:mandelate racemase/muconate lactonizing enzyme family protein [Chloroflexota bacterium]
MKIAAVETTLYEPRWDDQFAPRGRTFAAFRVRTDDGLVGIGRGSGEHARHVRERLRPLLLGEDPRDLERLWTRMYRTTIGRHGQEPTIVGAVGALDVALWDLLGKSVGLPCWRLLGGFRDWVPAYADVPTRAATPEELGEQLAACVAMGYRAVKFHILRPDPEHIVAETRAARRAIGPDVALMVDVFRALDVPTAIEVARRIEEYDLFWLEEPVLWHDQPLGLAAVARATRIPIAGGEGESSIYGCRAILERGGVAYLQADVLGAGGYTSWRKIAGLAEAFHARIAPHGAGFPEINAHLVAAFPHGATVPATTPNQPPEVWAHLYQDFRIRDGRVQLTERPGLGLDFDEGFLARYRVSP